MNFRLNFLDNNFINSQNRQIRQPQQLWNPNNNDQKKKTKKKKNTKNKQQTTAGDQQNDDNNKLEKDNSLEIGANSA